MLIILIGLITGHGLGQPSKNTETVIANGIEMYYEVYGEGEPLLLLHGWTQSSSFWSDFIPTYAQHFKVYSVDLRGHGRTTPLSTDFSIKKSARDIEDLLDHLEIKKVNAIGLSFGGLTLLELARTNPNRIKSLILIGTSHNYIGGENKEDGTAFSYDSLPPAFVEELKKVHFRGEAQIRALFDPQLDYSIQLKDEELQKFQFRTLIVHGDHDEILGVAPAVALHKNIPNSDLWVLPNTGHLAILGSNRKKFLTTSLRFLTLEDY